MEILLTKSDFRPICDETAGENLIVNANKINLPAIARIGPFDDRLHVVRICYRIGDESVFKQMMIYFDTNGTKLFRAL